MWRQALLGAMLLTGGCTSLETLPPVVHDPTVAYPFTEATIRRTDVSSCADRLLKDGGYGRMPFERAAFLLVREDDLFECRVWPATYQHHEAQWEGAIPEGTAAVLHTHPAGLPAPSAVDAGQARRIGVPVLVVTPGVIAMVSPSTGVTAWFSTKLAGPSRTASE